MRAEHRGRPASFLKAARAADAGAGNLEHEYMSHIKRTIMLHANIPNSPPGQLKCFSPSHFHLERE